MVENIKKGLRVLFKEGPLTFFYKVNCKWKARYGTTTQYQAWIKENEKDIMDVYPLEYKPLISVIVPVYNVLSNQLIECIESVKKQTYTNWELCLVDDASTWDEVVKVLKKYENNKKIHIVYRKENGHISKATNDGIKVATGEFIALLDCDDVLSPNALFEMAKKLNENKEYDFIYSDEDKISDDGKIRHMPHFKPDWSPDTLMSHMYTCHFALYRKTIVDEIGGFRVGFEGAQDYDFTLRFTEKTNNIGHISKILYHWRERAESTAINPDSKPYIFEAARKSKEDALKRRGLHGDLEFIKIINQYRVNYIIENQPLISVIIPSKDNYEILKRCMESLIKLTEYKNYEIVVIDNGSNTKNKKLYEELCEKYLCTYHYEKMNFNFSKMCNIGANLAKGDFYLFLNDDIEVIESQWLKRLLGQASLKHIGAVGAKLLYPNTTLIQHTGVINISVGPVHYLAGFDDNNIYYFGRNVLDYNCSAVTAACLMIQKEKFIKINGFNEDLAVTYNDVDLCFKLVESDLYNVVRTDVVLYHHESISRGNDLLDSDKIMRLRNEQSRLYTTHPLFNKKDFFYNMNLTQSSNDFGINIDNNVIYNKIHNFYGKLDCSDLVEAYLDNIHISTTIYIEGWAFVKNTLFTNLCIKQIILVDSNKRSIIVQTKPVFRPDVTVAYGNKKNYNFSGFRCLINKKELREQVYEIYVSVDKLLGTSRVINTGKYLDLRNERDSENKHA